MNILMLGWELPPHNSGGLGVACYYMSKALAQKGSKIDFVVPYTAEHPGIDFMKIHGATKLSPLERNGLGAYDTKTISDSDSGLETSELKDIRGVQKNYTKFVERMVKELSPDVIHAHDWLTMEAGIRAKEVCDAPLVVHVHATEFDRSANGTGNPIIHEIEYQGLMMADRIMAVSAITKQIIIDRYGIPADKIEVVHNAIDADSLNDGYEYDFGTYRYLESLKEEGYTVVSTVARFTMQKGLSQFVKAAAKALEKYDKLAFLLAGDGELRDELIQLSADLGISDKLFFTGFIRGKQWRDSYSVSDIFVMSSVSEPFGLTALEAAHHDDAVILTYQSGVSEVLNSVLKYDFWDIDRLADQMIAVATSPALKSCLQQDVKKEYTKISWGNVADKILRLYQSTPEVVTA